MSATDTTARINDAIASIDRSLEQRIAAFDSETSAQFSRVSKIVDELEREIDDLADGMAKVRLQLLVARLDKACAPFASEPAGLATHDLLDPLRILSVDLRHNY